MNNLPSVLVNHEESRIVAQTIEAIESHEYLYQRSGMLVRVVASEYSKGGVKFGKDSPRIVEMKPTILSQICSESVHYHARVMKENGDVVDVPKHPPKLTVLQVLDQGNWPKVRQLRAVVEYPVLRPDGTILQEPGYDQATGILYSPSTDYEKVSEEPTLDDAKQSVKIILELVDEFPFVNEAHRAGWLAGVLTPAARYSFDGCSPMFFVEAAAAGSGKTLLSKLGATIMTGTEIPIMIPTDDDEEQRKRLFTIAFSGARMVLIDNITGVLGGAALNGVLTTGVVTERLLGKNDLVTVPWNTIVYADGNNCRVAPDTHRRVVYSRIEANDERPEDRQGFKIKNLLDHVKQHRTKYVHAVLTILRAYAVHLKNGGKKPEMNPMGSFDQWSDAVRSPLIWAGMPDPHSASKEWRDTTDTARQALGELLHGWKELCDDTRSTSLTAAQALAYLDQDEREYESRIRFRASNPENSLPELRWTTLRGALESITPKGRQKPTAKELGDKLRYSKSTVVGDMRFDEDGKDRNKVTRWKVSTREPKREVSKQTNGHSPNTADDEQFTDQLIE